MQEFRCCGPGHTSAHRSFHYDLYIKTEQNKTEQGKASSMSILFLLATIPHVVASPSRPPEGSVHDSQAGCGWVVAGMVCASKDIGRAWWARLRYFERHSAHPRQPSLLDVPPHATTPPAPHQLQPSTHALFVLWQFPSWAVQ